MMDPLPSFNKVYSMISRIENQKSTLTLIASNVEASALAVKFSDSSRTGSNVSKASQKKKDDIKKVHHFCTHCHRNGHLEESCFKKHNYLD